MNTAYYQHILRDGPIRPITVHAKKIQYLTVLTFSSIVSASSAMVDGNRWYWQALSG